MTFSRHYDGSVKDTIPIYFLSATQIPDAELDSSRYELRPGMVFGDEESDFIDEFALLEKEGGGGGWEVLEW